MLFPQRKPRLDDFTRNFLQIFKEEIITILYKSSQGIFMRWHKLDIQADEGISRMEHEG
jgi:hypothetical protein